MPSRPSSSDKPYTRHRAGRDRSAARKPGAGPGPDTAIGDLRRLRGDEGGGVAVSSAPPVAGGPIRVRDAGDRPPPRGPGSPPRRRRRRVLRWRTLVLLLLAVVAFAVAAAFFSYRGFASEWGRSNDRIDGATRLALDERPGNPGFSPTTILVLGLDRRSYKDTKLAEANRFARSDTMMLIRVDPNAKRIAYLSIPRDTIVDIPGFGENPINQAFYKGGERAFTQRTTPECSRDTEPALICGAPLAIATVKQLTGIEVNHVMVLNFNKFPRLVDAVGGVPIDVPRRLDSTFGGKPHVFEAGPQTLSGARAQEFVRIRKGYPQDNDAERAKRQQLFVTALQQKIVTPRNVFKLRQIGAGAADAITTDLSPRQMLGLGWARYRAKDVGGPTILPVVPDPADLNRYLVDPDKAPQAIRTFVGG